MNTLQLLKMLFDVDFMVRIWLLKAAAKTY